MTLGYKNSKNKNNKNKTGETNGLARWYKPRDLQ
jgi:hypothetical protein